MGTPFTHTSTRSPTGHLPRLGGGELDGGIPDSLDPSPLDQSFAPATVTVNGSTVAVVTGNPTVDNLAGTTVSSIVRGDSAMSGSLAGSEFSNLIPLALTVSAIASSNEQTILQPDQAAIDVTRCVCDY